MTMGSACLTRRYEVPSSVPNMDERAARAILRGVRPKDVASVYGINLRTAYRWRKELVAVEAVTVDGWTATFARRRRQPPVRISAWERANFGDNPLEEGDPDDGRFVHE